MTESDLLPPDQAAAAIGALLGDSASQREVLEMAVALSDAGIEPIEIFKMAAMESLRTTLKKNKLQSSRKATIKGSAGKEFKTAVEWWKAKLTGHSSPAISVWHQLYPDSFAPGTRELPKKNKLSAISRAVKRQGKRAKERALFYLAFFGKEGYPDPHWMNEWQQHRIELSKPLRETIKKMPKEISELMLRNPHF
jgi:hypothetical protein